MKYLLLLGQLPGEGLWSSAENYNALVAQIKEAFGEDYNPIFKYKLACNPKMLSPSNGTCHIIIDDEDDFDIWKNGCVPVAHNRDVLDDIHYPPTPLTTTLYVFRKEVQPSFTPGQRQSTIVSHMMEASSRRVSPAVLHADNDVVKMPLYSLLPPLLLLQLGVRVTLRHSNAAEAILFSSRTVSGAGEGHWGLLVRKVQSAWGVLRPCFRYLDLDSGVTAMNIFNVRDYMFWSHGVGRERTELVVLEHVYRDTTSTCHSVLLLDAKSNKNSAAGVDSSEKTAASFHVSAGTGEERPYTVTTTAVVRGVHCGLYGPQFTTKALIPLKNSACDTTEENSLEHHQHLVKTLTRSGIF